MKKTVTTKKTTAKTVPVKKTSRRLNDKERKLLVAILEDYSMVVALSKDQKKLLKDLIAKVKPLK